MTESINTTSQPTLSLGQQFKSAREALNLSIEDVAQKTNLKKSHIESLENDIFILQNVAPTFVRGYVRNYVRFLRLPEELVSSVNYGEVTIPKEIVHKTSSEKVVQKSQNQWVKYLTIFVLLGAIGMTLLWWWQDYQAEQQNRDQFVNNAIPVEATPTPANTNQATQVEPIIQPATTNTETVVANTAAPANEQPAQPLVQAAQSSETAPTPTTQEPATQPAPVATEVAPQIESANVLQQTQTNPVETEQPAAVSNDELRIEITGKESWITVKNTKSKKSLAEKLYTNGEVLTFNGNEQYRLTIGAPANVKLYYKGQLVPLKIDGRVARIKLPLAQ
ncbi:RodZ domain-containing protein [Actinobacillus minor]|uniref:RodZ domain-containing protein n=1 Tax=Actinobacillus minor TaxID=51047 RepID=UPI0026F3276A|nr:RodZ domain-containing protein [Actinobacillus minor]